MNEVDAGGRAQGSGGRSGEATSHPERPRKGARMRDKGEARGARRRAREAGEKMRRVYYYFKYAFASCANGKKTPASELSRAHTSLSLSLSLERARDITGPWVQYCTLHIY
jgi:hypothetical protein